MPNVAESLSNSSPARNNGPQRPVRSAPGYEGAIVLLLIALVLVFAAAELVSRYAVPRISNIEHRTEAEYRALFAPSTLPQIAVLGNSLLLEGVDFPALQGAFPEYSMRRWVVERTAYVDWYYALRRLYAEGLRAKTIFLMLDAGQTVGPGIRDEYFAYRMLKTSDWLAASRDASLSPSQSFSLLLGNLSAMYGLRDETRKVVLTRLVPGIGDVRNLFIPTGEFHLSHEKVVTLGAERIRRYADLVREHGGRLIFIVPASLDPLNGPYLVDASARVPEAPVLVPLATREISKDDFRDGYHLNPAGASRFTAALVPLLRTNLLR